MFEISSSTSPVVQGVLWSLVGFSIVTWTLIVVKTVQIWRMRKQNVLFRTNFWASKDIQAAANLKGFQGPAARLVQAGFDALQEIDSNNAQDLQHFGDRQDVLERALRQQIQRERVTRESGLAVLASIGSTSPFVGLFGTVWGIMHALTDISKLGNASLEVVAGPIGEALVATGFGIAVAVPAVLAYNFFIRRLKTSSNNLDDLAADLIAISRRASFRKNLESTATAYTTASASASPSEPAAVVRNLKGAVA